MFRDAILTLAKLWTLSVVPLQDFPKLKKNVNSFLFSLIIR